MNSSDSYLFVYGTLMRHIGHPMHRFLTTHTEYFCDGCFQGKLFQISWYPAVVPSSDPTDEVHGEVHRIRNESALFETLDDYEMCSLSDPASGEYIRQIARIRIPDGNTLDCHIYLYNRGLDQARHIPSGKFISMRGL